MPLVACSCRSGNIPSCGFVTKWFMHVSVFDDRATIALCMFAIDGRKPDGTYWGILNLYGSLMHKYQ